MNQPKQKPVINVKSVEEFKDTIHQVEEAIRNVYRGIVDASGCCVSDPTTLLTRNNPSIEADAYALKAMEDIEFIRILNNMYRKRDGELIVLKSGGTPSSPNSASGWKAALVNAFYIDLKKMSHTNLRNWVKSVILNEICGEIVIPLDYAHYKATVDIFDYHAKVSFPHDLGLSMANISLEVGGRDRLRVVEKGFPWEKLTDKQQNELSNARALDKN